MNKMTVIISFLNEGNEVRKTVKNLVENSDQVFDIILINDCSTDNFDYESVATEFNAHYVKHTKRKGVTFSRDEGVALCKTQYFILLDAHMRIFQRNWIDLYIIELEKNPNSLLCASTVPINTEGEILGKQDDASFGTTFRFSDLGIDWISNMKISDQDDENAIDIPCVLGASYACSKEYWIFFRGLNGLKYYGFEEQYISIKVWLSGGSCKVLKNIKFGHIFRDNIDVPYVCKIKEFTFNQLLIVELFYTPYEKWRLLRVVRDTFGVDYVNEVIDLLVSCSTNIHKMRNYYNKIFIHDINYLYEFNKQSIQKYR